MDIRLLPLLVVIFLVACKEENDLAPEIPEDVYEIIDPKIKELEIVGNKVQIEWEHLNDGHAYNYELWIDKKKYKNPPKNFTEELRYDKLYTGELIANYPEGIQGKVEFQFQTQKSKILFVICKTKLYAINLYNMETLWEYNGLASFSIHGAPYIHNDQIIVGNYSIISLNILTGEKKWEVTPEDPNGFQTQFLSVSDGNNLFLRSAFASGDYLYSFDLNTGEQIFKSDGKIGGHLTMGTYIYSGGSGIYAYDKSGNLQWSTALERNNTGGSNYITSQPVILNEDIFFSDKLGRIYSINNLNGKRNWYITSPHFDECLASPTIYQSNLIISGIQNLLSINTYDGQIDWIFKHQHSQVQLASAPFIYDNKIVFGESFGLNGSIVVLNAENGQVIWEKILNSIVNNGPIVFEDNIYAGTNAEIVKLNLQSGEVVWSMKGILSNMSSPVIAVGQGETVIYSTDSGNVH